MIAPSVVREIYRLLAQRAGSMRRIARMTGVSHGTVARLARRPQRLRDAEEPPAQAEPSGPHVRCPGCGGLVHMPCPVCGLRRHMAGQSPARRSSWAGRPEEPLRLDLKDEHRRRYEEVRARRTAAQRQSPQ